jgi:hypothetical protein
LRIIKEGYIGWVSRDYKQVTTNKLLSNMENVGAFGGGVIGGEST